MRYAGEHLIAAGRVSLIFGHDRAKDSHLVCVHCGSRHEFADLDSGHDRINRTVVSADFFGCVRLGVPGFVLRRTTEQPEHDD